MKNKISKFSVTIRSIAVPCQATLETKARGQFSPTGPDLSIPGWRGEPERQDLNYNVLVPE